MLRCVRSLFLFAGLLCLGVARILCAAEVLVWEDSFDTLDRTKWSVETGLIRNNRAKQIYVDDTEHVTIEDGALKLTATYSAEGYTNPYYGTDDSWTNWRYYTQSMAYASGAVNSLGKFSMRYGRAEIRAKFNVASGAWPAIWMLGSTQEIPENLDDPYTFNVLAATSNWPPCGEIDLMEYATQDGTDSASSARQTVHSTLHWGDNGTSDYHYTTGTLTSEDLDQGDFDSAEWHRYGITWTPETITLTFDDRTVLEKSTSALTTASGASPFTENAFHFILNLALGSMANDPPEDGTGFPISHAIDYVKVWQDPTVAGNQLLLADVEQTWEGLTSTDENAHVLIPAEATVQEDGALVVGETYPVTVGGFDSTFRFMLTAEVEIPEDAGEGTVLGWRCGSYVIRLLRQADGTATFGYAAVNSDGSMGSETTYSDTFTLASGNHQLTIIYDATPTHSAAGATLFVDGEPTFRKSALRFSGVTCEASFLSFGNDATDVPSTPLKGLIVHSVDFKPVEWAATDVGCSDSSGTFTYPSDSYCLLDGTVLLGSLPLKLSGFTASSDVCISLLADVPEGGTGALIGVAGSGTQTSSQGTTEASYTLQAEVSDSTSLNIRYEGTTEHTGTTRQSVETTEGRHLFTFTASATSGCTLLMDGETVVSAPDVKWGSTTVNTLTFGATTDGSLPLSGLRILSLQVDTSTSATPDDPFSEVWTFPESLKSVSPQVKLYLTTLSEESRSVSVPQVTYNGVTLSERDAAEMLYCYQQTGAADLSLAFTEVAFDADGNLSIGVENGTQQVRGALSLLGATGLSDAWLCLASLSAPFTQGTFTVSDSTYTFFKCRPEVSASDLGLAATYNASVPSIATEMPLSASRSGETTLLSFSLDGLSEDLSLTDRTSLTLSLSGTALTEGQTFTLTIDGTTYTSTLQSDGSLTFTGLNVADDASVSLAGVLHSGTVQVVDNSWDASLNGTSQRVASILATDLVSDGFVLAADWSDLSELFYRIPALATDGKGNVLAVYDVRYGGGDLGDTKLSGIDLGENMSQDAGVTWSDPQLAVDVPNFRGPDGTRPYGSTRASITKEMDIGDASILYDPGQDRYHLIAITGGGLSWASSQASNSVNDCVHYTRPNTAEGKWENRTSLKETLLGQVATTSAYPGILAGPGHGMVTTIGKGDMPAGALVFPMQGFVNSGLTNAQCFAAYSTDGGETWQATGLTPATLKNTPHNAQENCIVELDDGSWLMMSKGGNFNASVGGRRLFFRTTDFMNWTELESISGIVHVQGSCLRLGTGSDGKGRYVMAHQIDASSRAKLALIFGTDLTESNTTADSEGVAWDTDNPVMLHKDNTGGQGYNSLCMLDDTTLGVLYETNGQIWFERIDVSDILQ